jgi:hypothetical protein
MSQSEDKRISDHRDRQVIHEQNRQEATRRARRKVGNLASLIQAGGIAPERAEEFRRLALEELERVRGFYEEALEQASKESDARMLANWLDGLKLGRGE